VQETRRIRSGEVELAVTLHGAAGRPVVVLIHGYPDSSRIWDRTVPLLSADWQVVTYDVRGAGDSDRPTATRDYRLERLADDLAAVADAVSPDRPIHLVGHDWGSIQAWETVATGRMPGRIASFTSISGPCLDHAGHWLAESLRSADPGRYARLARQALRSWYVGLFQIPGAASAPWKLGLDRVWPQLLRRIDNTDMDASPTQALDGELGVRLYRANVLPRLARPQQRRTAVPVQLLVPTRDRFVDHSLLETLPQWVERLWRHDLDAGHWLPASHPEWLARQIDAFVRFVESGEEPVALQRARVRGPRRRHSGKLVVVTGAGSGIGRETALAFATGGADIVVTDISAAGAEQTAERVRALGALAWTRVVDVGNAEAMEALARWVETELGAPDVVVNNAGIGMSGPLLEMATPDWERILSVNLWGVIHGSRLFGRQMVAAGKRGHIVNVSSGLAFCPTRITGAYNTTKAAVQMLSECLRAELAGHGIGVSAVYPGVVNTDIVNTTRFVGEQPSAARHARAQRLFQRRNLKPDAVARAIVEGVESNRAEVRVGAEVHAIRWVSRLAPALTRRLARVDVLG
jgi:NAD(P)-dependent dehydrogenase (short-subunit alcohol dehydrogenase family)/pimeloyl-ACP methyl ester carboxylesterase